MGGTPISWSSKTQTTVALSSCEAEYMASGGAVQEVLWVRSLLNEIGYTLKSQTTVYCDNQGCIAMTKTDGKHGRTKHIDIRHHFVRLHVREGRVALRYVPTNEQIADIFTKPLPAATFLRLRELLFNQH
jgi:hypothetical protein